MSDIICDFMSDMPLIMDMKYELNYPFFFTVSPLNTTVNNIIFMINNVGILLEVNIQANVTTGAVVNHPTQIPGYPFTNTVTDFWFSFSFINCCRY